MMRSLVLILLCLFHFGKSSNSIVEVIYNEDQITGTCTGTCYTMGTSYNKLGCSKLYGCKLNAVGWNRGFVRCDYCRCQCEVKDDDQDVKISTTWLEINEIAIFGTCSGTCDRKGLLRTNFKGCQDIRDCDRDRYGYLKGFYRCDYCKCKCINRVRATKYELFDVKYDMSAVNLVTGNPTALTNTYVENDGNNPQTISRTLTFQRSSTKSLSTAVSVEVGLTLTVTAGVTIGVAKLESSVSTSITTGFSTTTGTSASKTTSDSITANCLVPGHSRKQIIIKANKVKVDVPFTAKIKRIYKDGTFKIESTRGVLSDMLVGDARVTYEAAQKLKK